MTTEAAESQTTNWLAEVERTVRKLNRGADVRLEGGALAIHPRHLNALEIDGNAVPADDTIEVVLEGPVGILVVRNLRAKASVLLRADWGRREHTGTLHCDDVLGSVRVEMSTGSGFRVVAAPAGLLQLVGGSSFWAPEANGGSAEVLLEDGRLNLEAEVGRLEVAGDASLAGRGNTAIGLLEVGDGAVIGVGQVLRVEQLHGLPGAHITLVAEAKRSNQLVVRRIADVSIACDGEVQLLRINSAHDVTITGSAVVSFADRALAERVCLDRSSSSGSSPILNAGAGSFLSNLRGCFVLGDVSHAHLEGASGSFEIHDLSPEANSDGAFLDGFRVPHSLRGRRVVAALEDAAFVSPRLDYVPGWPAPRLRSLAGDVLALWKGPSQQSRDTLRQHAELSKALAQLTSKRGSSGANRTAVAWCAYRTRQLATDGRSERLLLAAYRCLGYGERVFPPLIAWVVLALFGTSLIRHDDWVFDWSLDGLWTFTSAAFTNAVGPFISLFKAGSGSSNASTGELLLRALIAVPLVTALFALRKYVKITND